ncbi:MAG: hypothetical protein PHR83_18415 [Paludibacter sp.]|nr:hypothetical protein [Paludibacter sp.]
MKKILISVCMCIVLVTFQMCGLEFPPTFIVQFTKDDLSHLIFDRDSITMRYNDIFTYKDSVTFLLNDKYIITRAVKTTIETGRGYSVAPFPDIIEGSTDYQFNDSDNLNIVIGIHRANDTLGLQKLFWVEVPTGIYGDLYTYDTSWIGRSSILPVDTAKILGKIFRDVYKLPNVGGHFKKIYFAKQYGYIYIEKTNGNNLKLIKFKHLRISR